MGFRSNDEADVLLVRLTQQETREAPIITSNKNSAEARSFSSAQSTAETEPRLKHGPGETFHA